MTYDVMGARALDYAPCRYGGSKLVFRGPSRRLDGPYVAFLGGTEFYGKFVKTPVPALVESDLGVNCVNFGVPNAGVDVFANDTEVLTLCNRAEVTVLQVVGVQNLSNRFYTVHPRRNDRFVTASALLKAIYPEVDFAEFHFTRHMLNNLYAVSPERFVSVREELQAAWMARMRLLIGRMNSRIVLTWVGQEAPPSLAAMELDPAQAADPMFVSREMLETLEGDVDHLVEIVVTSQALACGTEGMIFSEMEAPAANQTLGPRAHGEAAMALGPVLHTMFD